MRSATLVPSQPLLQATGRARATVLRSFGHGAFLVRRLKNRTGYDCPLLDYEVRRLAEGNRPVVHGTVPPAAPPETRTACRKLLMLFMAGLIQK